MGFGSHIPSWSRLNIEQYGFGKNNIMRNKTFFGSLSFFFPRHRHPLGAQRHALDLAVYGQRHIGDPGRVHHRPQLLSRQNRLVCVVCVF